VERSLSAAQQQMSAVSAPGGELMSHDVGDLQRQLVSHESLMNDLESQYTRLHDISTRLQATDSNIAGTHTPTAQLIFCVNIRIFEFIFVRIKNF